MRIFLSIIGGIFALVLVVALAVGLWFGGWALAGANQSAQYKVNTNSQQYQASLVSQQRDRVQAYDTAVEPGQKAQIKMTFCAIAPSLNPAPTDLVVATARICS